MWIDLHIHEKTYSLDSKLSLEDIVTAAKVRGLDAVCITDHDDLGIRETAYAYSKQVGYPIFVGVEYYSLDGDLVTFGVDEIPNTRIPAQEYIDWVNARGGICYSAHPYRDNNRGLRDLLYDVTGLGGIEVLNANTVDEENAQAQEACKQLNQQSIGASDAHKIERVGLYATWFPQTITTTDELVAALKQGLGKAGYHTETGYRIL